MNWFASPTICRSEPIRSSLRQRNDARRSLPYAECDMDAADAGRDFNAGTLSHLTIAELLARYPALMGALLARRMACVGCTMARFETLPEAAAAYHLPVSVLLQDIALAAQAAHTQGAEDD
jgi:hybrid cluster-associated redox disulfide protein